MIKSFQKKYDFLSTFLPFLKTLNKYNQNKLKKDLLAGLVGAIIVLPQGIAFATIAGLPPQYGIYSAIVPTIIAALFGSSHHLVSGPTTAISLVVYASISQFAIPGSNEYISLVLTLSFIVGFFQLMMGILNIGVLLNFVSHTVVIGFTAGAAILIASSQIKNFFGLQIPSGSSVYEIFFTLIKDIDKINPYVTSVALVTLISGIIIKKFFPKIPYMIPSMILGSILGYILNTKYSFDITQIKTVGALPQSLPPLSMPDFNISSISKIIPSTLAITFLATTEAIAIAKSIAIKSGQKINANQEFIGQGLSNIIGSFFSAYPSSGSFNRSGLNYEAGAVTSFSSVFGGIFLAIIILFVAPLAKYLPNAVMAAILFLVAYGLIDSHHIKNIIKTSKEETILLITTFLCTLFIELEMAIIIGVFMSIAFYLKNTSKPNVIHYVPDPDHPKRKFSSAAHLHKCPQLCILKIEGPLFFGSISNLEKELKKYEFEEDNDKKYLLIVCNGINFIDISGGDFLVNISKKLHKKNGKLFLSGLHENVKNFLIESGYINILGEKNIFISKTDAIYHIYHDILDKKICKSCKFKIFHECHSN